MNGADGYMEYRLWASPWRQIVEDELRLRNPHKIVKRERKSVAQDRLDAIVKESKEYTNRIRRLEFYEKQKRLHQMEETVGRPLTDNQRLAVAIRSLEGREK